jgi:hypothetical protein
MFEAINQAENNAKNITPTNQESGGEAINIKASADQDIMFLANNIQRRFEYGEATIASRSKTLPGQRESPDAKYRAAGFTLKIVPSPQRILRLADDLGVAHKDLFLRPDKLA